MGNAVVVNRCPYSLYLWLVGQNKPPPTPVTIPSKSKHVEPFHTPCVECGVSFGVSKTPSLSSVAQFEYALYYNISLIQVREWRRCVGLSGHVHGLKQTCE